MKDISSTKTGLLVSGDIRFENVLSFRRYGECLINEHDHAEIDIDLAAVRSSDVSGLTLLLRWMQYAEKQNKCVRYRSIPPLLLKLAEVCGIARLLG